jgi:hypothetical protein
VRNRETGFKVCFQLQLVPLHRGVHLTEAEKRGRREKAAKIHRAAVTTKMIERYGEESRRHAMRRAANARVPVEELWAAEDDFALLTAGPEDARPGNLAEARKSRHYAVGFPGCVPSTVFCCIRLARRA